MKGIEIQGNAGDDVVAVNSGNVVWVAPYRGYGRLVMVEGADDTIYAYGGNGETFVHVGDRVSPGTVLGKLGTHLIEKDAKVFFLSIKTENRLIRQRLPVDNGLPLINGSGCGRYTSHCNRGRFGFR